MVEDWRSVPGYEGLYSVSTAGRVRSEDRIVVRSDGVIVRFKGRVLRIAKNSSGKWSTLLCRSGKCQSYLVHRLVALAFIPNPKEHPVVRHLDDNPDDNSLPNLAWGTHSDNQYDRVRNGIYRNGQDTKTHCKYGHEYSFDNTYITPKGHRMCKTCRREFDRNRRRK